MLNGDFSPEGKCVRSMFAHGRAVGGVSPAPRNKSGYSKTSSKTVSIATLHQPTPDLVPSSPEEDLYLLPRPLEDDRAERC